MIEMRIKTAGARITSLKELASRRPCPVTYVSSDEVENGRLLSSAVDSAFMLIDDEGLDEDQRPEGGYLRTVNVATGCLELHHEDILVFPVDLRVDMELAP